MVSIWAWFNESVFCNPFHILRFLYISSKAPTLQYFFSCFDPFSSNSLLKILLFKLAIFTVKEEVLQKDRKISTVSNLPVCLFVFDHTFSLNCVWLCVFHNSPKLTQDSIHLRMSLYPLLKVWFSSIRYRDGIWYKHLWKGRGGRRMGQRKKSPWRAWECIRTIRSDPIAPKWLGLYTPSWSIIGCVLPGKKCVLEQVASLQMHQTLGSWQLETVFWDDLGSSSLCPQHLFREPPFPKMGTEITF